MYMCFYVHTLSVSMYVRRVYACYKFVGIGKEPRFPSRWAIRHPCRSVRSCADHLGVSWLGWRALHVEGCSIMEYIGHMNVFMSFGLLDF